MGMACLPSRPIAMALNDSVSQTLDEFRSGQRHGFGWKRWSRDCLYGTLGLFHEYRVAY
jgi:hypothetical protein